MMKKINAALALLITSASFAQQWYTETLHNHWGQTFKIDTILFEEKTEHQHLIVFTNSQFGTVLALDGVIQTTERDEFVYHEMICHVPLLAHGNAKKVLIIGGGDGGTLREVLRHTTVEKAVVIEIDQAVIEISKKYLPLHSQGAFDDPRAQVIIEDGCKFVKNSSEKFDIIICDSTDPIGPGEKLFTAEFYKDCHALLSKDGIFVCQNGAPFLQTQELRDTKKNLELSFDDVRFYTGVIPTYLGGFMTFGWATDNKKYQGITREILHTRMHTITGNLRYYTPEVHLASFALPQFIKNIVENNA